jgi:hypothetical protein
LTSLIGRFDFSARIHHNDTTDTTPTTSCSSCRCGKLPDSNKDAFNHSKVRPMKPVLVIRHVAHEGLGTIADALARNQLPYTVVDALAGAPQHFDPRHLAWLGQ